MFLIWKVIFGAIISYFAKLEENYKISIIGDIKTGLPSPEIPPLFIITDVIGDCIIIAIIGYTM
jgi:MFS superfamily sulfate permease-like transporter